MITQRFLDALDKRGIGTPPAEARAKWDEAAHPRNPADGKFTGMPGAGKLLPGGQQDAAGNPLRKGDKVAFGNTTGTVVGGSRDGRFLSVKWDHDGSTNRHVVPGNVKVINDRPEAGGQPSSAPHLDGIKRSMDRFERDGGEIEVGADPEQAKFELQDLIDNMGPEFANDEGVRYTQAAIEEPGARLIVARADGVGLAGALALRHQQDEDGSEYYYVEYVGSTGMAKGTGSVLAKQVAEIAARDGLPVYGQPSSQGAATFWGKVGWTEDPNDIGTELFGWTPGQTREVASL